LLSDKISQRLKMLNERLLVDRALTDCYKVWTHGVQNLWNFALQFMSWQLDTSVCYRLYPRTTIDTCGLTVTIDKSRIKLSAISLSCSSHAMPLSTFSVIWYWPKGTEYLLITVFVVECSSCLLFGIVLSYVGKCTCRSGCFGLEYFVLGNQIMCILLIQLD